MEVFSELLNRKVELPDEPKRIVSLAPAVTETLYMLGIWDRVVGVSYFCNKPPEASQKPRVGAYLNVNYKLLNELQPDLVLTTTGIQYRLARELAEKGYPVYPIPLPTSVYGILDNIVLVGLVVGRTREARELAAGLAHKLSELSRKYGLDATVYYEVDLGGPVTIGAASYIDHGFSLIGLKNVFHGVRRAYFTPGDELANLNPDIIVYEPKPGHKPGVREIAEMFTERGLGGWKAVRDERIIVLEPDTLAHYGPSFIRFLEELASKARELLSSTSSR